MDSSHGCDGSLSSNDVPRTTLQPHDPISNEEKKIPTTTIFTQNVQGLWRCPKDPEGNILLNHSADTSKMEYIIDYMTTNDIGVWLVQETWEEGNESNIQIGDYHIFRHNSAKGEDGRWHLFKGVGIILSPQFHVAWQATGSPPPITMQHKEFEGRYIQLSVKFI